VRQFAIDETSCARGHDYITLAADAQARAVIFLTEGNGAETIEQLTHELHARGGDPQAIESICSAVI
jgi:hypothetical protein